MQTRIIKADHVELALVTHRMRKANPTLAQFCALSNGATWQSCDRRTSTAGRANRWTHPPMMLAMLPSVSPKLITRTRMSYGLREVKATWGIGYKAMLAEVAPRKGG